MTENNELKGILYAKFATVTSEMNPRERITVMNFIEKITATNEAPAKAEENVNTKVEENGNAPVKSVFSNI